HVCAVAFGLVELAVVQDGRVEVGVAGRVAATAGESLTDTAGAVDEHLLEAAFVGPVVGLVAQVPFAEDAGRVARRSEYLSKGSGAERQAFTFEDGVGDAIAEFMTAGHQRRARGRAGWADVEVGEANTLTVKPVEVGCLQNRVAVTGQVAITLVIREQEDNVGPGKRCFCRAERARCEQTEHTRYAKHGCLPGAARSCHYGSASYSANS